MGRGNTTTGLTVDGKSGFPGFGMGTKLPVTHASGMFVELYTHDIAFAKRAQKFSSSHNFFTRAVGMEESPFELVFESFRKTLRISVVENGRSRSGTGRHCVLFGGTTVPESIPSACLEKYSNSRSRLKSFVTGKSSLRQLTTGLIASSELRGR